MLQNNNEMSLMRGQTDIVTSIVHRRHMSSLPSHTKVMLPALSPTMETGSIVSWEKQEGDEIAEGDLLAEIETDKATVGFESSENGYMAKIILPAGSRDVKLGTLVCIIVEEKDDVAAFADYSPEAAAEAPAAPAAEPEAAAPAPAEAAPKAGPPAQLEKAKIQFGRDKFASPLAKLLARDKGVDVNQVAGSGPGGRVIGSDVASASPSPAVPAYTPSVPAYTPSTPSVSAAPFEDIPVTSMRKVIANRLTQSKQTIPHYYLTADINMDKVVKLRKKINQVSPDQKISINDFVIKASALACMRVPEVNSSWQDSFIRKYNSCDVSVAVSTESGLITPIVFAAEQLGLRSINSKVVELANKARDGKLQPAEFQGGTFTISNLGMFGIDSFSAVINPPQSAILAVSRARKVLHMDETTTDQKTPIQLMRYSQMMSVTLSCDHRVIDGAVGAQWVAEFKRLLEDPEMMLL